jgi:hypothetical protein
MWSNLPGSFLFFTGIKKDFKLLLWEEKNGTELPDFHGESKDPFLVKEVLQTGDLTVLVQSVLFVLE